MTVPQASFRCVLTSLEDEKFMASSGQSGHTAYQGLALPFSQIGIGRSNNFIESFTVAAFVNGSRSLRVWTPIIPKSVLFIVTENNAQEPDTWKLDVLVKPSEKMVMIIIVDAVFLLVLGLIIIVLHMLEKAEDRKDK
jgi:integrin alpha FG-GAP repeat containing protein 1